MSVEKPTIRKFRLISSGKIVGTAIFVGETELENLLQNNVTINGGGLVPICSLSAPRPFNQYEKSFSWDIMVCLGDEC